MRLTVSEIFSVSFRPFSLTSSYFSVMISRDFESGSFSLHILSKSDIRPAISFNLPFDLPDSMALIAVSRASMALSELFMSSLTPSTLPILALTSSVTSSLLSLWARYTVLSNDLAFMRKNVSPNDLP